MDKAFVITSKGAEDVCSNEIKELIAATNIKKNDTVITFDIKKFEELAVICYKAQSIYRGVLLLEEFKVDKSLNKTELKLTNIGSWLKNKKSFSVECERKGDHDFHSVDIAGKTAAQINKKHKLKTDFDNPDVAFYMYIYEDKGYFGVDFSGFELAKRQYKIFNHQESLKGITGYVLASLSGLIKDEIKIDPFMGSGIIPIEAALKELDFPVQYYNKDNLLFIKYLKNSEKFFKKQDNKIKKNKTNIYGYDAQLRYLKATQKNAKLAGIEKSLNLSKVDVEWLDTRFDKHSVDYIITDPPRISKHKDPKKLDKTYKELFYQADYVLKKNGKVVVFTKDNPLLMKNAEKHKFKISEKYPINQGLDIFNIVIFTR